MASSTTRGGPGARLSLALLGLWAGPATATAPDGGTARMPEVTLSHAEGGYRVSGTFTVDAPLALIWSTLTDYDGLPRFVTSMRRSKVVGRSSDGALVEQTAIAQALMFSQELHLLLQVTEQPMRSVGFRDVSLRDFSVYEGSWTVLADHGEVRVGYQLRAMPRSLAGRTVGVPLFQPTAARLLAEVRTEILRRKTAAQAGSGAPGEPDGGDLSTSRR